ncbi:MAG: nitroreductase [Rugosibacter sp.]|jgi:nitroreductase
MDATVTKAAVDDVMYGRKSVRAFLPQAVPQEMIADILRAAARAPSGTNTQPWQVHVLTGKMRNRLVDEVCQAFDANDTSHKPDYDYYAREFFDPYLARRRKVGWDLYGLLGIKKGEAEKTRAQHRKNYTLFDAPVALMFVIDRRLAMGSWLDFGMFLQNVMLAARARGLDTCPQAAWIDYHRIVEKLLNLGEHDQLVCGMALGYADNHALVNTLTTERAALEEFVHFHD